MIVLGLLLLILVAVVIVVAVVAGDEDANLNLIGASIDTNVRWVFLAGAISLLLLVIGLDLLGKGLRRARKRRQEVKRLKAAAGPALQPQAASRSTARQPTGPQDPDEQAHFESTPRD